jgi:hypothetical protein
MELVSFSIPTFRKATIQARLEKLAKKAVKYGNPDITIRFGETKMLTVDTNFGPRIIEYIDVIVSGNAPKISGWDLLARIEITELDENLVHTVPGSHFHLNDTYRKHDGYCDHCKTNRKRNDVYVLDNGDKQIAVGRTCLRDFLGIDDPKSIVGRAQFFEELDSIKDEDHVQFNGTEYFGLHTILLKTAAFIRKEGYISKAKQQETGCLTTGETVLYSIQGFPGYDIETNEEDEQWVHKTIEFFRSKTSFGNDYMDNIRVIMKQDIVKHNHIALIASSVITAQRELAPKTIATESNFVGKEKERIRGLDLLLEKIIYLGHGPFGSSFLHLLKDANGNKFSWITTNKLELPEGSNVKLDATVKQHKVYNGVKQTVLTRAKQLESVV